MADSIWESIALDTSLFSDKIFRVKRIKVNKFLITDSYLKESRDEYDIPLDGKLTEPGLEWAV